MCTLHDLATLTLLGVVSITACNADAFAGPTVPFMASARPRNPDHFQLGNGTNLPTPYVDVRGLAIASGMRDMMGYEFQDWMRPGGTILVEPRANATHFHVELERLVPGGFYTMWLVRVRGSSRGPKTDLAINQQFNGPPPASLDGTNGIIADESGHVMLDAVLPADHVDAAGTMYFGIDLWDEIHVAFHADYRAYGFAPGPNHWTQVVLPIRPRDGSALVDLVPLSPTSFSTGNGTDGPTTFLQVRDRAAAAGVAGIASHTESAWAGATGQMTLNLVDFGTQTNLNVIVTADGLVPNGPYTAWLVAADGSTCPLGESVLGPAGRRTSLFAAQLDVDEQGRGVVETTLSPSSTCGGGRSFGELSRWERVEIVFHADAQLHGTEQGPSHWAQISAPIPSLP